MIIFDSRDLTYKKPFGAVKQDCPIHFKIILPRNIHCEYAFLKVHDDQTSDIKSLGMFWCGMLGDSYEMWECDYTPSDIGIYWYNFAVRNGNSTRIIGKDNNSSKALWDSPNKWQITCYKKDFTTPSWLYGGIMYQIFPDRFYNSGVQKKNVPKNRFIHSSWDNTPIYEPNENGEYLNNDFFGGDLLGIIKKIPYLKSLGVTCVYLNPVFESSSNHRYNTADYQKIDPLLGTKDHFKKLCTKLKENGIRLILDGVFSHTGDDSIYFNKNSRYHTLGAYNSKNSQFYDWYNFDNWPDNYNCWWGMKSLPETNENCKTLDNFINGDGGIVRQWLKMGSSGWRLDVADELPDEFLYNLRKTAKDENPDSLIIGEVWEDASNKISYGHRRKFLLGGQLDSVMNYPFKDAILDFVTGTDGNEVMERILSILENYPPPAINTLMNSLSTHDTIRAITRIAGIPYEGQNRTWQASTKLTAEQYEKGITSMKLASAIQFTLPGIPCIYYGDEAGMEGYLDPFNRRTFPWGSENTELIKWYQYLAEVRKENQKALSGDFKPLYAKGSTISYMWENKDNILLCIFNSGNHDTILNINIFNTPRQIKVKPNSCKFIDKAT